MNKELIKRIITSICLISLLLLVFFYTYILIISLIIVSMIAWIEFNSLIFKIYRDNNYKKNFLRFLFKVLSLIYLLLFSMLIFEKLSQPDSHIKLDMVYLFSICILSDIGGLIFGKFFKGKKLTKISPNKTISGSIGSFTLSFMLVPVFFLLTPLQFNNIFGLMLLTIAVSFSCQLGDLFISYMKRKAHVKDTGDLLPGHGGILDRIDGLLFAIPIGVMMWEIL
jgi:phosphatidate cytidylyltransferase